MDCPIEENRVWVEVKETRPICQVSCNRIPGAFTCNAITSTASPAGAQHKSLDVNPAAAPLVKFYTTTCTPLASIGFTVTLAAVNRHLSPFFPRIECFCQFFSRTLFKNFHRTLLIDSLPYATRRTAPRKNLAHKSKIPNRAKEKLSKIMAKVFSAPCDDFPKTPLAESDNDPSWTAAPQR